MSTTDSPLRSHVVFHLTGRPFVAGGRREALPVGLRPALMAPYRRLEDLRHDFPIVLADGPGEFACPLTALVDAALRAVAPPGPAGEALRKRTLRVERGLRHRVMAGGSGTLRALWDEEARAAAAGTDEAFLRDATRVRDALPLDGTLVACDEDLPFVLMRHAWRVAQREKSLSARARIEQLALRLESILRADDARSPAAFTPASLRGTFGESHRELFDFAAMSRLLTPSRPRGGLPTARRARIEAVLDVLRTQELFPAEGAVGGAFATTGEALDEYLRRLPGMVALHRALLVGELEADGRYRDALHDPIFEAYDECSMTPEDLQFFPDLLVCVRAEQGASHVALLEALSTGVPLKVLVQFDDVLEQPLPLGRSLRFGARPAQLATTASSLGPVFVLQTVASHLLRARADVWRALDHAGPALFCIYGGPATDRSSLPTYLVTAAALQSRAFPAFCYDPGAGPDFATRFRLGPDPQPSLDWPVETLEYADPDLQSVREPLAFTFLDFALCDPRYAAHFDVVPRSQWDQGLAPAAEWLARVPADPSRALPYVLAVDEADLLCRLVVDDQLVRAATRCLDQWHRLQELVGLRGSRVERARAEERATWEARLAADAAPSPAPAVVAPAEAGTAAPASAAAPEPTPDPDQAYVETLRCSSCNECTLAFPAVFAYNADKQAFLRDPAAATYRQLVEAAEACQVAVIHPGKPRNPSEPGLEELLERAKPFL